MAITEILRPNAAGNECNILRPFDGLEGYGAPCPNHWKNVDEVTADDDATRVQTNSGGYERDLYNLTDPRVKGTIEKVVFWARVKRDREVLDGIRLATYTESTHTSIAISQPAQGIWQTKSSGDYTHQPSGGAWTKAALTSMQFGVKLKRGSSSSSTTYCTQLWVVVHYTNLIYPSRDITRITGIRHLYNAFAMPQETYNTIAILGGISPFATFGRRGAKIPSPTGTDGTGGIGGFVDDEAAWDDFLWRESQGEA